MSNTTVDHVLPTKGSLGWWRWILNNREGRMAMLIEVRAPQRTIDNENKLIEQAQEEVQKMMN